MTSITRLFQVLALIVFCFAIGEAVSIFLTGVFFGVSTDEVFQSLNNPASADRDLLMLLSFLSGVFRFLIIPGVYLFFTDRESLRFISIGARVRFTYLLMTVALFLCVIPTISILIELNYNLQLPDWMSAVEAYFRQSEMKAQALTAAALSFEGLQGLLITIIVVAIIPGIVEEIFFRGIVQTKIQNAVSHEHYAILISAALFSLFHFQFYGFIPRMVMGMLLGYIYLWSRNIWYPIIGHVVNNLFGVLSAYFIGTQVLEPTTGSEWGRWLLVPSIILSAIIISRMRKSIPSALNK